MSSANLSKIGFVLMAAGFLWGAYVIVNHPGFVEWGFYVPAALVSALGAGMLRFAKLSAGAHEEKVQSDITTIEASLLALVETVESMDVDAGEPSVVFAISGRIDDECMDTINAFVEAREAMIHRFGLAEYAAMMDAFALGERSLNRAWCASADGYIDEVRTCLERAESNLKLALAVVQDNLKKPS